MSERTEVSFDAALMMALRADAQKELDEARHWKLQNQFAFRHDGNNGV